MTSRPFVLWLIGFRASGKTAVAGNLAMRMSQARRKVLFLDESNLRKTICDDLGQSWEDRVELNRRAAHLANFVCYTGAIPILTTMIPTAEEQHMVRRICASWEFLFVLIDADLSVCIKRDKTKIYPRAREGVIKNIPGVDIDFDVPSDVAICIKNEQQDASMSAAKILQSLQRMTVWNAKQ